MNTVLFTSLFLVQASPDVPVADPVDGEVRAVVTTEEVIPATRGDEGAPRFPNQLPNDLSGFQPVQIPETDFLPMEDGPVQALSYDVLTGQEEVHQLPTDPFRTQHWISGRELADEVDESLDANFGSFSRINSSSYPWSTQARIFFGQGGGNWVCSGTMIDPKNVITAGHCVHDGPGGTWSYNVVVAPRWDGDANQFGTANGVRLATFTGWTNSGSGNHDMGFIRLDRPVGFLTGWLGTFYNSSNSFWSNTTFNLAGFPATPSWTFPAAPHAMYYAFGRWNRVYTSVVDAIYPTTVDFGGLSGSGVYYITNGSRYVGGDHRSSYTSWGQRYRRSTRMTSGKFNYFHTDFGPGGYSSSRVDYVPLRVRSTSTSIRRGTTASFSYKVANSSRYNPASARVDVDVYLSSNDNISVYDTRIQSHYFNWNFGAKTSVNVNAAATIPSNTPTGYRYLGIIVDESDNDNGNNDTDGWDAQRIYVRS